MTRALQVWIIALAIASLNSAAEAAERAKAEVDCRPGSEDLQYECTIRLVGARTGAPLTKSRLTVGADMPSMPMMHNIPPVKATPTQEPGTFHALIELEMHGDWALQLNITGEVRDRLIKTLRFEEGRVVETKPPSRRKQ
jgi:hypothetical protein